MSRIRREIGPHLATFRMEERMQLAASAVLLVGTAFILYSLIGYPLVLWLLARYRPKTVSRHFEPKTVTVLLPVHNGEKWLSQKLRSILSLEYPRSHMQVVVISDGSTDSTDEIAREFAAQGVELIRVPKGGKAQALNKGLEVAHGEILFFPDVRQPLAPDCLRNLVACFADDDVGG